MGQEGRLCRDMQGRGPWEPRRRVRPPLDSSSLMGAEADSPLVKTLTPEQGWPAPTGSVPSVPQGLLEPHGPHVPHTLHSDLGRVPQPFPGNPVLATLLPDQQRGDKQQSSMRREMGLGCVP